MLISIAGTGHRPQRLGGFRRLDRNQSLVVPILTLAIEAAYHELGGRPGEYIEVVSGMAQGWDTWLALAALKASVPVRLICANPCKDYAASWPSEVAKAKYEFILSMADEVVPLAEKYYDGCLNDRNLYMVKRCTHMWAMWDKVAKGGTYNCLKDARRYKRPVRNFWDDVAPVIGLVA